MYSACLCKTLLGCFMGSRQREQGLCPCQLSLFEQISRLSDDQLTNQKVLLLSPAWESLGWPLLFRLAAEANTQS